MFPWRRIQVCSLGFAPFPIPQLTQAAFGLHRDSRPGITLPLTPSPGKPTLRGGRWLVLGHLLVRGGIGAWVWVTFTLLLFLSYLTWFRREWRWIWLPEWFQGASADKHRALNLLRAFNCLLVLTSRGQRVQSGAPERSGKGALGPRSYGQWCQLCSVCVVWPCAGCIS